MPEGPEVAITADQLQWTIGATITAMTATSTRTAVWCDTSHFANTVGGVITAVSARGKKLLITVTHRNAAVVMLVSSLGMTGRWSWHSPEHPEHCLLSISITRDDSHSCLYYTDSRTIGSLQFCYDAQQYTDIMATVGPAHLVYPITGASEYPPEYWWQVITEHPKLSIGTFIKDQKFFAGVGNYLRSEILYYSNMSPHRLLSHISQAEAEVLRQNIVVIMLRAYHDGGKTLSDFISPDGSGGRMLTAVYPNDVRAPHTICPRGGTIVRETMAGQRVHWVPQFQL